MTEHTLQDVVIADDSVIQHPCEFEGRNKMYFGAHIRIRKGCWFDVSTDDPRYKYQIELGDGTAIGRDNQFSTSSKITLGRCVMTASNVHIATQTHNYEDIEKPIMYQGATDTGPLSIGDGTWIGRNAIILCASVGKQCVIAAGSYVNKDVPDYCVVAGVPAKIIKRYNQETKKWERCV